MRGMPGIAAVIALSVATPAAAEWTRYAGDAASILFSYDPQSVQRDGTMATVWIRFEGPGIRQRAARLESQAVFDCARRTIRVIMTRSFDESGHEFHTDTAAAPAQPIAPRTHTAALYALVCPAR